MYIHPFVAGVLVTLVTEIAILLVIALKEAFRRVKNGGCG